MRRIWAFLSLLLLLSTLLPALALAGYPVEPAESARPASVDRYILEQMAAAPDGRAGFLVRFREQADLAPAYQIRDWDLRGRFVYDALEATAERSQARVRDWLEARGIAYRTFIIDNSLFVTTDEAVLDELAAFPEVGEFFGNHAYYIAQATAEEEPSAGPEAVAWGVTHIGAQQVWNEFGVKGQGIVVANMTSGVDYTHEALYPNYRCGSGSHLHCWADPAGGSSPCLEPCDGNGSGTHTMGTMVGDDAPSLAWNVGVAPDAQWIACRACNDAGMCEGDDLLACADWFLSPGGSTYYRPHVIDAAWGGAGCNSWFQPAVQAWRAAGIFAVFAVGASGPDCETVNSPADLPESFAAGASDDTDVAASFSGRGSSCYGGIKPEVVAPGVNIPSAAIGNTWANWSGTGMSSAHAAGMVALLWSAAPYLVGDISATEYVITSTAVPYVDGQCGDPGPPNNVYGWGRIDAYAAVEQVYWQEPPACQPLNLPRNRPNMPGLKRGAWSTTDFQLINLAPGEQPFQAHFLSPQGERVYTLADTLPGGAAGYYDPSGELPPGFTGTLVLDSLEVAMGVVHLESQTPYDGSTVFPGVDDIFFGNTAYVPVDECTVLYVHSLDPGAPANVLLHVFDDGALVGTLQRSVPPEGTATLDPRQAWMVTPPLHFVASAVVEADVPVEVTAHATCGGWASLVAPHQCGSTLYAPYIPPHEPGVISTTILVQNPSPSYAWVDIRYSSGVSDSVYLYPWEEDIVHPPASAAGASARILASQPVVVVIRAVAQGPVGHGAWSYRAFAEQEATPAVAVPVLFSGYGDWQTGDGLWVMNPGLTATAELRIRYVTAPTGTVVWDRGILEPGQVWQVQTPVLPGERASAILLADRPILALVRARNTPGQRQVQDKLIGYTAMNFYFEHEPVSSPSFTPTVNGLQVSFVASALGNPPFTFLWSFGDGAVGQGQVVNHTYALSGTYIVQMTATNNLGFDAASTLGTVGVVDPKEFFVYLPLVYKAISP